MGCEFYTADIDNFYSADDQIYAIVVSNPHDKTDANVLLEHGNTAETYQVTLVPGELHVIEASCISGCFVSPQEIQQQGIGEGKGFRLTSDVPILAYQWNPYGTSTMSTDASLLIPSTSLEGTIYYVAAWGYGGGSDDRSQITVVITEDNTTLTFTPSVDVPNQGGVGPFTAGIESDPIVLNKMDVISIAPTTAGIDLNGTRIDSDKPISVFGGHS